MPAAARTGGKNSEAFDQSAMAMAQLGEAIVNLSSRIDASTSLMLQMIREFDERAGHPGREGAITASWLSARCGLPLSDAQEKVRCARALNQLPRIMGAFAQGAISYAKVCALTRVANAENEAELMTFALQHGTAVVEERCRQLSWVTTKLSSDAGNVR